MVNSYELFVGIDVSKGKADAAIIRVDRDRNIEPKFLRKRINFKFVKSEVNAFIDLVRSFANSNCTNITFAMEVTGNYMDNLFHWLCSNTLDNEHVKLLNTTYVKRWCDTHNKSKSDPLDAQSIASIIANEKDVLFVNKTPNSNIKGHTDLKDTFHRYCQRKKSYTQEVNRLIGRCDKHFPELQYVFEPKSAVFLAILSIYPTTYDIMHSSKAEVYNIAFTASKKRVSMDKIDELFRLCSDTLNTSEISLASKRVILDNVDEVLRLKEILRSLEKELKVLASSFEAFDLLKSMPGCGNITASAILSEISDIKLFSCADKLVSYIGLCPCNSKSGSSVDTHGKISKRGSRYLRHAIYMLAEFARRHNPVLKAHFEKIKNGNKKRHKLAVTAIANKVARYVYSVLKTGTKFVISYEQLILLNEETQTTFFSIISTEIPRNTRKQIYSYSDINGEIFDFIYTKYDE
ncbi:IS110 family transposase [Breznakia sp. OttesenSCG-928-G09]|nr:IS110 family transposase [Breznakia sp. OttesenSCG-928-G09]